MENRNVKLYIYIFQRTLQNNEIKTKLKKVITFGKTIKELQGELNHLCSFIYFNNLKNTIDKLISKKVKMVKLVHEHRLFNLGVSKTEELNPNNVVFNYFIVQFSRRLTFF